MINVLIFFNGGPSRVQYVLLFPFAVISLRYRTKSSANSEVLYKNLNNGHVGLPIEVKKGPRTRLQIPTVPNVWVCSYLVTIPCSKSSIGKPTMGKPI